MITQMEEYYIRKEGDEDSRGPFTLDQLSSLVEAEQVDRDTFYYEATSEKWVQISTNEDLVAFLFPERRRLKVKPKDTVSTLNVKREDDRPIVVDDMLAAAEGRTSETAGKRDPTGAMANAAIWGLRFGSLIMIISSFGLLVTNLDAVTELDVWSIMTNPFTIAGLIDLLLGGILFLGSPGVYPWVKLRAAIGGGFFAFLFWSQGDLNMVYASIATSVGLYFCTVFLNLGMVFLTGLLGLAGAGWFAYTMMLSGG
ncbi:MAG: GYF domain-containing protein [Opitutaceae bacterium]